MTHRTATAGPDEREHSRSDRNSRPAGAVDGARANYYSARDEHIAELDAGTVTSSELLAAHLADAHVVKAFNTIYFEDLASEGRPAGSAGRRALPIAGDSPPAKATVAALIDEFGFDVVDPGPLREGRRFQPGTPAYNVRLDADALRAALANAG